MTDFHIGRRLKTLREAARLNQETMAGILGLNDRQSVSQIETGNRRLTADELVRAITHFGVSLEALTNPFLLPDGKSFSWRQRHVAPADLFTFEARAGEWIGAYLELNRLNAAPLKALLPRAGLTHASSFEEAVEFGETVAAELNLGDRPARRLIEVLQSRLGVLVLMIDALPGVSGAACRLDELNAILINRDESEARRNYDLAHEFFHLLTWDQMRPDRFESAEEAWEAPRTRAGQRNQRIEQLADNFGSGLLMPGSVLDELGEPHGDLVAWLVAGGELLGVSSRALKWRLVNAKRAPGIERISNEALTAAARERGPKQQSPLPFSKPFIETIGLAIERGHLSGGRAAQLLDLSKCELGEVFEGYGVARPVEI